MRWVFADTHSVAPKPITPTPPCRDRWVFPELVEGRRGKVHANIKHHGAPLPILPRFLKGKNLS